MVSLGLDPQSLVIARNVAEVRLATPNHHIYYQVCILAIALKFSIFSITTFERV